MAKSIELVFVSLNPSASCRRTQLSLTSHARVVMDNTLGRAQSTRWLASASLTTRMTAIVEVPATHR